MTPNSNQQITDSITRKPNEAPGLLLVTLFPDSLLLDFHDRHISSAAPPWF